MHEACAHALPPSLLQLRSGELAGSSKYCTTLSNFRFPLRLCLQHKPRVTANAVHSGCMQTIFGLPFAPEDDLVGDVATFDFLAGVAGAVSSLANLHINR